MIRFNDCLFTEPVRFSGWMPPACGGLVVVLAQDPNWVPRGFRPIYFGEFGNGSARVAGNSQLFVAVLPMPFSSSTQRRTLRDELIAGYNPIYQTKVEIGKMFEPEPAARKPIGFLAQLAPATGSGS
jgi:hypothetical protein